MSDPLERIETWFASKGWSAFAYQRAAWRAQLRDRSGLIHAPTGTGKTYAAFCGLLVRSAQAARDPTEPQPLTILWVTPLKALAADTVLALGEATQALAPGWSAGLRTGDTAASERARQDRRLPSVLVTTPESLALLIARADWEERLGTLEAVIVDEWHELIASKRGLLLELTLSRLRGLGKRRAQRRPGARPLITWGMSATLSNLSEAMHVLVGPEATLGQSAELIEAALEKHIVIDALLPESVERFPWVGHLGTRMVAPVVERILAAKSTLVFTNTRAQAELWYQALLDHAPELAGRIALHHGSLDQATRAWVEEGLRSGALLAVVCTSSLDLGVDFRPVEQVLQIGSPKGIARLLQRAGRSGHAPGATSRVTVVPTHALELVEAAAARQAASAGRIEARRPPGSSPAFGYRALDVLAQHLVTCALGGGFLPDQLRREVESSASYAALTDREWQWCLDFVTRGGSSLAAYPDFHRVHIDPESGRYHVPDRRIAQRHRMNIGTIVAEASVIVQLQNGQRLGQVEEDFIARLKPGDAFIFAGRMLEFIRLREMVAHVRVARQKRNLVPRWAGGKMPLTTQLADATRELIAEAREGRLKSPELALCAPLFALQARLSALPGRDEWLIEQLESREGWHLFVYPFEGRLVHLGLATLWAWRLARERANTFSIAMNDYGFELLAAEAHGFSADRLPELLASEQLESDLLAGLNAAELAKRQFREIARVAGLIDQGYPGEHKSAKQLQMSAGLIYDVFRNYDPENLLLAQAVREVLERQLEASRLAAALARLRHSRPLIRSIERPTPFSFPLMAERLRETLSNEDLAARAARLIEEIEGCERA
ncbi:MAG: ligase-associated DNA damage response DEXH box helicase [Casimicrobiaceae bacterium]|nr:ligase-associated DNA damage response DEXH box helicase [Casimicrobiaceae bacterium]MDW8311679.1 ligase-associated DNA damage response DEXH box helicase [Burkholderiales bacterium]